MTMFTPKRPGAIESIVEAMRAARAGGGLPDGFGLVLPRRDLIRRRPVFVVAVLLGMAVATALVLLPFVLLRG